MRFVIYVLIIININKLTCTGLNMINCTEPHLHKNLIRLNDIVLLGKHLWENHCIFIRASPICSISKQCYANHRADNNYNHSFNSKVWELLSKVKLLKLMLRVTRVFSRRFNFINFLCLLKFFVIFIFKKVFSLYSLKTLLFYLLNKSWLFL